jgi:hypothetical protein
MSKMTINGITTTNTPGQEQYEYYKCSITKKRRCQYDYRHHDGKLFSCIKLTLDDCRAARDKWLENR